MSYHTIGTKYEETKDIHDSDLVKLIKQDLKENLPKEYKVLARKEIYSMGWTIHFTIKNTGIERYVKDTRVTTKAYDDLLEKVEDIVHQYNYDDSDSMTDYFHVRFYSNIRIEK